MSLAELGMVVNSNFAKPLNEQARDMKYCGAYVIESSRAFKPDKSGWYKVIAVGASGTPAHGSSYRSTGGAGGVAIKTIRLDANNEYSVSFASGTVSFDGLVQATKGGDGTRNNGGSGGSADGGDLNYYGNSGSVQSTNTGRLNGASVGVYIPELMRREEKETVSGYGILGYGASGGVVDTVDDSYEGTAQKAAVIIIPLELEE